MRRIKMKCKGFRNYIDSERQDVVKRTYKDNHINMTVDHVLAMHKKWLGYTHGEHTIEEILAMVDTVIDDSDPDTSLPNTVHAFQTAEGLRSRYPTKDWLHLIGLLHDLGKVMCYWGEPQWNVVGDTYPVGCAFSDKIVFNEFFGENPDSSHPVYSTTTGAYDEHCGLSKVLMSWGHDEYMYHVLRHNGCSIPEPGLFALRYHSFYPWHQDGAYQHLTSIQDNTLIDLVHQFNEHDLYTKSGAVYDQKERQLLWDSYYKGLCEKYGIGGKLRW